MRSLRGMMICLLTGLILVTVPFAKHAGLYTVVLGLLLCLLGPIWYSWFRGRLDYFESIHIFGVTYFVYFGLGAVWTVNDPSFVAYDLYIVPYVPKAALYCLFGYLALIGAYYGPWVRRDIVRPSPHRLRGPMLLLIAGGLGIVGYAASSVVERAIIFGGSVGAYGTLAQLSPFFLFAWALIWLLVFSKQAERSHYLVLFGMLLPGALLTASATFSDKSLLMTLIGIPIVARWYARKKIPWLFLVVLLLILVFVVFPFYNTYRWSDPAMGQMNRMVVTYETIQSWDTDRYLLFSLHSFTRRLALINSVAVVLRDVGRWVPYAKGDTIFMPTLTYYIPRVIWPDKPILSQGRDFGRTFRVTNFWSRDTYIGVTVPGELYWNFDLPGVIVGMALLGLVMRLLYRRYGEGDTLDPVRRAVHIMLLIQVAHLGWLATSLVMVSRTLILLELLFWAGRHYGFLEGGTKSAAPASAPVAGGP
jgi:hypothetical protein